MTRIITLAVVLALAPFAGATSFAQSAAPAAPTLDDARWAPWLGCWRSTDDLAGTGTRVCVAPATGGVSISTVAGSQRISEEARIADGRARPVDAAGCTGTATARWSDRGVRLYRTATATCDGGATRTLASVAFFVEGPSWIDVETVDVDGDLRVRVTRLVRAPSLQIADGTTFPRSAAAAAAASSAPVRWTVDDVLELAPVLPADGVQAAISEAPGAFALNARSLAALADAGVGDRVIDLMVGVTWPDRFVVQRAGPAGGGGGGGFAMPLGGMMMSDPFFSSVVGPAAMYGCYSPYGWARSSYWSDCAMYNQSFFGRYPGYYSGYWGAYGPDWVTPGGVVPQPGTGSTPDARLVNGRGYTQVRPIDTTAPLGNGSGFTGGGGQTSGTTSAGSGSGVSSGGYSGGGGASGGGDRTAVPRGPGGR